MSLGGFIWSSHFCEDEVGTQSVGRMQKRAPLKPESGGGCTRVAVQIALTINMAVNTSVIEECVPGVFRAMLWCAETFLLRELLDPSVPFVLSWGHFVGNHKWESFRVPLLEPTAPEDVLSRGLSYDYVLPTARFLELLPQMRPGISAVQLRGLPPDYLNLDRIRGRERFRLLEELGGWHVLLDTPGNDFGQVCSPSREVVEKAVRLHRDAFGDDPFSGVTAL